MRSTRPRPAQKGDVIKFAVRDAGRFVSMTEFRDTRRFVGQSGGANFDSGDVSK